MDLNVHVTFFTSWCGAGSWSNREASWVLVALTRPFWVVSLVSDPENISPVAVEEAGSQELLEELGEHRCFLVEVEEEEEEAHKLEVEVGL